MNQDTGEYRKIEGLEELRDREFPFVGTEKDARRLSKRIRLGEAQLVRRKAKRKKQRQSRKANR